MEKLELQKTANEIRKGIVTAVDAAKAGHPLRRHLLICILRKWI